MPWEENNAYIDAELSVCSWATRVSLQLLCQMDSLGAEVCVRGVICFGLCLSNF